MEVKIAQLIEKPEERLALCQINNEVNYGVFAQKDIEKDSVICFYSGEINDLASERKGGYAFEFFQEKFFIKPKKFRGIASFLQHLPNPLKSSDPAFVDALHDLLKQSNPNLTKEQLLQNEELYCIKFLSDDKQSNLATANLICEYVSLKVFPS